MVFDFPCMSISVLITVLILLALPAMLCFVLFCSCFCFCVLFCFFHQICSLVISVLIFASTVPLARQSMHVLLQRVPSGGEASLVDAMKQVGAAPAAGGGCWLLLLVAAAAGWYWWLLLLLPLLLTGTGGCRCRY